MIKSIINVDLPSVESERRKTLFDQLKELFGARIDLRSGYEETTVSAFSLIDGVCNALYRAQISDAISLIVDKKVVFLDTLNVTADSGLLWQAAQEKGVFAAEFQEVHVAYGQREAGLYVILDVRVQRRVLRGTAEMTVELAARPEALVVQNGETAQGYAERVTSYARNEAAIAHERAALDGIAQRVAGELGRALPGSRVNVQPAHVQLIRQESRQLRRFGKLGWGSQATTPHYRPVPTQARSGAYADPFYYYWHDPYWDFTNYLMLDAVLHHGGWHSPEVVVVNPEGQQLYTADQAETHQHDPWVGSGLVSVGDHGVGVSESLPEQNSWGGSDLAAGSERGGGWGGSDVHDHGWGGSDTGSSDSSSSSDTGSSCSSSSSCGSSCSGSSCGSSCGGGGGGD